MRRIRCSLLLLVGLAACGDDLPDDFTSGNLAADDSESSTGATVVEPTTSSSSESTTTQTPTTQNPTTQGTTTQNPTTQGGGTVGATDECKLTSDCPQGLLCVAPFDESLGPNGKGLNDCVAECVEIMDETRWCADVAACCDPTAECTDRGYCVYPDDSTGGATGTTGESSTG